MCKQRPDNAYQTDDYTMSISHTIPLFHQVFVEARLQRTGFAEFRNRITSNIHILAEKSNKTGKKLAPQPLRMKGNKKTDFPLDRNAPSRIMAPIFSE
jgi:hypothetical protein